MLFNFVSAADKVESKNTIGISLASLQKNLKWNAKNASLVVTSLVTDTNKITRNINSLIETPKKLANSVSNIYQQVAGVVQPVIDKVEGFAKVSEENAAQDPPVTATAAATTVMQASAVAQGLATSVLSGELVSRSDAVRAASTVASASAILMQTIETTESAVPGYIAPPGVVEAMARVAAKAQALLLEKAFSLRLERIVVLDRERTPLELVWEFYGSVDDRIDEFIEQNHLIGDELFIIPSGREIRYYVG